MSDAPVYVGLDDRVEVPVSADHRRDLISAGEVREGKAHASPHPEDGWVQRSRCGPLGVGAGARFAGSSVVEPA